MQPASTKQAGVALAVPDTLNLTTPAGPVPTPFPNTIQIMQAMKEAAEVKMAGKGAVNQGSEIPTSQGGSFPGVKSGVCLNKGQYTKGSGTVTVKGKPCEHLTSPTQQNGANANAPGGAQIAPSQVVVLVGF